MLLNMSCSAQLAVLQSPEAVPHCGGMVSVISVLSSQQPKLVF